ncbi:MAG: hypothetical protein ACF8TS_11020, partial [Maioricimonas sp. JB049]
MPELSRRGRNRRQGGRAVCRLPGAGRVGFAASLVVRLIATAFVVSLPVSVMAQPDGALPGMNGSETQPPVPVEEDRSGDVAIGLLAVVGVALLGR